MRPERRAEKVVRRPNVFAPVAHRLVDRVLQCSRPGIDAVDLGAEEFHPAHVHRLPALVLDPHVDDALEAEPGGDGRGRHAMLPRPGLGDETPLAHRAREQTLADRIVDLVRACVKKVLALQDDPRSTESPRKVLRVKKRRRSPGEIAEGLAKARPEIFDPAAPGRRPRPARRAAPSASREQKRLRTTRSVPCPLDLRVDTAHRLDKSGQSLRVLLARTRFHAGRDIHRRGPSARSPTPRFPPEAAGDPDRHRNPLEDDGIPGEHPSRAAVGIRIKRVEEQGRAALRGAVAPATGRSPRDTTHRRRQEVRKRNPIPGSLGETGDTSRRAASIASRISAALSRRTRRRGERVFRGISDGPERVRESTRRGLRGGKVEPEIVGAESDASADIGGRA